MTAKLIEDLRQKKFDKEIKIQEVKKIFADFLSKKLSHLESDFDIKKICDGKNNPKVLMMVGANGSGKTSMCAKIANLAKKSGKNAF